MKNIIKNDSDLKQLADDILNGEIVDSFSLTMKFGSQIVVMVFPQLLMNPDRIVEEIESKKAVFFYDYVDNCGMIMGFPVATNLFYLTTDQFKRLNIFMNEKYEQDKKEKESLFKISDNVKIDM